MLVDLSIKDFFSKMSSKDVPGGGSGAALVGTTGVSLLIMAAEMAQQEGYNLNTYISELQKLQQALLQVERELSTAQQQLDERTTYLANPESYLDGEKEKLKQALREQAQFEEQVSLLELRWLELQTSLDDLVDE